MQPSTRCDAVRLVSKFCLPIKVDEIAKHNVAEEMRMNGSNAVHMVRPNDGKVGHPHLLLRALLNDRHACKTSAVVRKATLDSLEEVEIDVQDDLEVSRQQ